MPRQSASVFGKRRLAIISIVILFSAVALLCLHMSAGAQEEPAAVREAHWQEDLNVFSQRLSSGQKDFAKVYPKEKFDAELNAIRRDLPQLSNRDIKLRLMRLVASAHIVHNTVDIPNTFRRLPLTFYWYSDGLAVTSAAPEYSEALGARVLRFGSMTPEQLEVAVAPYVSYENEHWLHGMSPTYMRLVDLLHQLNVDDPDGHVMVTLAKSGGQPFTLSIAPPVEPLSLVDAVDALHIPARLAIGKGLSPYYWYKYLPESQTLYIQYNKCGNDPKLSFKDFTNAMFASVDSLPVQRTIVDLRFNNGGDNSIVSPLEHALQDRSKLSAHGRLYALISWQTTSSGMDAAADLRNRFHAILVGEPLGEKPNTYAEVRNFTLPNSGLVIRYSVKYFRPVKDSDPLTLAPDILVTRSIEDFLAGRDPVLEAALRHPLQ